VKWDGYRMLAAKHGKDVRLLSLKEKDLTSDFPTLVEAVRGVECETALIDGESRCHRRKRLSVVLSLTESGI